MATEVVMPQMGESVAEGTIVRWIKKVGDSVERDEPLFEISTDKVDAEIPSPVAGVVTEIRAKEGETVPIDSVVAIIGPAGSKPVAQPEATEQAAPAAPPPPAPKPPDVGAGFSRPEAAPPVEVVSPPPLAAPSDASFGETRRSLGEGGGQPPQRSSPLVRRIAKEHNIDVSLITGTGIGGRVTKHDILAHLDSRGSAAPTPPQAPAAVKSPAPPQGARPQPAPEPGTLQPMSVMRKKIAEHMIASRRTSAHVHSVFEVNFSRVAQARESRKAEYERAGTKLTYLSFIVKAVVDALREVPVVNASVEGEAIRYHKDVNIGIAVALDWGLIVPVIRNADEKNLLGLSKAIADLANRARAKQLKPEEVTGGTFTITNPGVFGALFGMPIINQPQVAILGVGNVEKRPIVIDDAIAIRTMAYLSIGYDHRIIDGAEADEFMSHVKRTLENWDG
jgi:2-oxoglutarate dehydrogenase E2 component (dihydrolipoamide succinyltransferase)